MATSERAHDAPIHALLVEDNEDDALLVERALVAAGLPVVAERVETALQVTEALERRTWDVVISDCALPSFSGARALELVRRIQPDTTFLVVSGTIGEEAAAGLMKAGAHDYVAKGNLSRLAPVIRRELDDARVRVAHRLAEERIRHLAFHDALTQLPNRHLLFERMHGWLREPDSRVGVLSIDVLGLDDARKTLGATDADGFLQIVGQRLQAVVDAPNLLAYLGSDRFAVAMPDTSEEAGSDLAGRLHRCLRAPLEHGVLRVRASASVGISLSPADGDTGDTLLRRAEIASECARRNEMPSCVYNGYLDIYTLRRLDLLTGLWQAADHHELELLYQPKADLHSGRVRSLEALIRWNRPGHPRLGPDEFIPLAEESGSIRPITAWVVNEALRQCAEWRRDGVSLGVAVNLPGSGIQDGDLVEWLSGEVERHELPPEALEVEITETALMRDPMAGRAVLQRLRDLGIDSTVDDFGAGYSSLAYLRNLPVRSLKIDKGFLATGLRDARDESIVRSAIALAHNLGLRAVAEGVEDAFAMAELRGLGCDAAQGYYISRPLAGRSVVPWVREAHGSWYGDAENHH